MPWLLSIFLGSSFLSKILRFAFLFPIVWGVVSYIQNTVLSIISSLNLPVDLLPYFVYFGIDNILSMVISFIAMKIIFKFLETFVKIV